MAVSSGVLEDFDRYAARCEAANLHDAIGYRRRIQRWERLGLAASPLLHLARGNARSAVVRQPARNRQTSQNQSSSRRHLSFSTPDAPKSDGLQSQAAPQTPLSSHNDARLLSRDDAPALFSMIDQLRAKAGAPDIGGIYLVHDASAWVTADRNVPGTQAAPDSDNKSFDNQNFNNRLYIGRALVTGLSPAELRALIAHELGHLACEHSAVATRLETVFRAWSQLGDETSFQVSSHIWSPRVRLPGVARFARWYARRLLAHACPVYRDAELEADRFSARLTSSDALCHALIRIALLQARELEGNIGNNTSDADILKACLNESFRPDARHPSLRERLQALDWDNTIPPPLTATAVDLFDADIVLS